MMTDVIVTSEHLRIMRTREEACVPGLHNWAAHHGICVKDFLRHGVSAERLESTGDEFALRLAAIAREEEKNNGRS